MRGSIRTFVGLFIVFGAVGGIDNATDGELFITTLLAVVGLLLMYSGVTAMNKDQNHG